MVCFHVLTFCSLPSFTTPSWLMCCSSCETVLCSCGCMRVGAISASGASTNARRCILGCGTVMCCCWIMSWSIIKMSKSNVRGSLGRVLCRPLVVSIFCSSASSCDGVSEVCSSIAMFRYMGCASFTWNGSVSYIEDVDTTFPMCFISTMA